MNPDELNNAMNDIGRQASYQREDRDGIIRLLLVHFAKDPIQQRIENIVKFFANFIIKSHTHPMGLYYRKVSYTISETESLFVRF